MVVILTPIVLMVVGIPGCGYFDMFSAKNSKNILPNWWWKMVMYPMVQSKKSPTKTNPEKTEAFMPQAVGEMGSIPRKTGVKAIYILYTMSRCKWGLSPFSFPKTSHFS